MSKKIKVGIIGTRGIPNNYGGFERFVELLVKEHDTKNNINFVIYGEKNQIEEYSDERFKYVILKTSKSNGMIYYIESLFKSMFQCDIIFCCGVSISFMSFLPRILGKKLVVNPDGCEWKRSRWSWIQRAIIKSFFLPTFIFSNKIIIDSQSLEFDFSKLFKKKYFYIPYQIPDSSFSGKETINQLFESKGIDSLKSYNLIIARLEPENNIEEACQAFKLSEDKKPLIIIGKTDTNFYKSKLFKYNNKDKIYFFGGIYDQSILNELRKNASLYIHGHSVGGTNPSLIEALSVCEGKIICHKNKYNIEVAKDNVQYFNSVDKLRSLINDNIIVKLKKNDWSDVRFNSKVVYENYIRQFKEISL
tara:strand:- start:5030 stop:6115 length:1086 start_codon:yes stop_codon:yes gene_type:complete